MDDSDDDFFSSPLAWKEDKWRERMYKRLSRFYLEASKSTDCHIKKRKPEKIGVSDYPEREPARGLEPPTY